ncbi:hypothetical protein RintRC_7184 [Richelia intracellularis]|nr:hypothetical protein RintRC_7184 [Richelia intracellularis]
MWCEEKQLKADSHKGEFFQSLADGSILKNAAISIFSGFMSHFRSHTWSPSPSN